MFFVRLMFFGRAGLRLCALFGHSIFSTPVVVKDPIMGEQALA